jgi:molybdate transport system substrate-binding protein
MTKGRLLLSLIAALASAVAVKAQEAPKPVQVFVAAPLYAAVKDIAGAFTKASGQVVTMTFAPSAVLARQIDEGAPAAVFIAADADGMNEVEKHGLIQPGARRDLLTTHLALIAPKDSPVRLRIAPWFPLLQALGGGKLALADATTSAGAQAQASLVKLNVWSQVAGQVVRGDPLALVAHGAAPFGIVYDTDALAEPAVRTVGLFPDDSHPPILIPAALLKGGGPGAEAFFKYLQGPEAKGVFERYGFRRTP